MFRIMVVEDDTNTRKLMCAVLKADGYLPIPAENGVEALDLIDEEPIDLMIVDIMMPLIDGYELTRRLRENKYETPIIMVTAKHLPQEKHQGFIVGTDDYMTKPIDKNELLLRIKALLRRAKIANERKIVIGEVVIDYDLLTVQKGATVYVLPPKEFYLLYMLLSYPGKVFTRAQLMEQIWGIESDSADSTVNVHINRLRSKFESFPEFTIDTVRGIGYKAVRAHE